MKRPGWILREQGDDIVPALEERGPEGLPPHDTLVRVQVSSLNYKDVLSWSGHRGITREYPHQPGVDAAGIVEESANAELVGKEVVITGHDLGMNTAGGHGGWIRVPSEWVVPKPDELSLVECMAIGTAGFTSAQSLYRIQQNGLQTDAGPIVVTGATGGVGSVAVLLLAEAGYEVVACTRQSDKEDWLQDLGASGIVSPDEVLDESTRPMLKGRWVGAVDTVGGPLLESILRSTHHRAVVTCCGMIGGTAVSTNIFPFILRGLTLVGIDSAECPMDMKHEIWRLLSTDWKTEKLAALTTRVALKDLPNHIEAMRTGQTIGRIVVVH